MFLLRPGERGVEVLIEVLREEFLVFREFLGTSERLAERLLPVRLFIYPPGGFFQEGYFGVDGRILVDVAEVFVELASEVRERNFEDERPFRFVSRDFRPGLPKALGKESVPVSKVENGEIVSAVHIREFPFRRKVHIEHGFDFFWGARVEIRDV